MVAHPNSTLAYPFFVLAVTLLPAGVFDDIGASDPALPDVSLQAKDNGASVGDDTAVGINDICTDRRIARAVCLDITT